MSAYFEFNSKCTGSIVQDTSLDPFLTRNDSIISQQRHKGNDKKEHDGYAVVFMIVQKHGEKQTETRPGKDTLEYGTEYGESPVVKWQEPRVQE